MRLATALLTAILAAVPAAAAPRVITSVMPVHSLTAAIMNGVGEPKLLLSGRQAEHRATFTPNQVAALGKADIVYLVGRGLETKLAQLSGSEAVNGKTFIELAEATGITTLPIREGGDFEAHGHTDGQHDDSHTGGILAFDPHVWLNPDNAAAMARVIAETLSKADPDNAATYHANAQSLVAKLAETSREIAMELAPVKDKPFIVFHDAYQYFEKRFGLRAVGSITDISAQPPSADRLQQIRKKLAASGAICVFREPQYDDRMVATVIEGSAAKSGVLDPLGADLAPGPEAYPSLLRNLARTLRDCLSD